MGAPNFTPEQAAVISARSGGVLVAASAGTGKTFTLTYRIVNRILDRDNPLDLERLLVVTFTDAAAKEMRDRIRQSLVAALADQPRSRHLQEQLDKVGTAQISTIHSFCRRIIQQYAYLLGQEPSPPVIPATEAAVLQAAVLEELFAARYEADDAQFIDLLDSYSRGLGDHRLRDIVLKVYEFTTSLPDPEAWMDHVVALWKVSGRELSEHLWLQILKEQVEAQLEWAKVQTEKAVEICHQPGGPQHYLPQFTQDWTEVLAALEAVKAGNWQQVPGLLPSFPTLKGSRSKEVDPEAQAAAKQLRDQVKKRINELRSGVFSRSLDSFAQDLPEDRKRVVAILDLVKAFARDYTRRKRSLGVVDFADLERLALELLNTIVDGKVILAQRLRDEYDEILIDEYQDTSQIQDEILYLISRDAAEGPQEGLPNRILIGDVKQSIYRFRLADPTLFVSKLGTYSHQPDAKLRQISLTHNFRSRKEVLEAVNYVFQQVMTRQAAEIDYTEGDFLTGGAWWYEDGQAPSSKNPVELYLLDTSAAQSIALEDESSDVAITAMEQEARFIAGRIHQLIEGGYLVFDNKTKKSRPLEYGDIAILLRSPSRAAETVRQVLQQQGIPARS